jgi:predicted LPLAT superfamily acyltransferase
MRALGTTLPGLKVRPLMYLGNANKIGGLLNGLNPELADLIINMNAPDAMLKVQEALENNEMVGVLADRLPPSASNQKMIKVDFLGKKAAFPAGPFMLASVMKVPVIFFTGLYRGDLQYDVYFEPFAETLTISRESREEDLTRWISLYAKKLEHYCHLAPYNWFNFYDFWQE